MADRCGSTDPHERLVAYYRTRAVRARLAEYCGGWAEDPATFSACALAGFGGRQHRCHADGAPIAVPRRDLESVLDEGADVCRSLADRGGTLVHLDVDYVSPDGPEEPYREPALCFSRLEPLYHALREAFAAYGIRPLVLVTGRGYHFTFRAPLGSALHAALLEIGTLSAPLRLRYERVAQEEPGAVRMGQAHEGAGRLLEHLCHEVMRRLQGRTEVPITLADVPMPGGGPFLCLDLTHHGDPLFARYARCAFSANQKPLMYGFHSVPPFVLALPREAVVTAGLAARESPELAAELATESAARIPDVHAAPSWVDDYRRSSLARFHEAFDRGPHLERPDWSHTYDALDLRSVPPCARGPLEHPNRDLLRPAHLRTVALVLWGMGWHPRSVASIIRSRYEKDHGWGDLWERYDPGARAEFYVRTLCGAVADGLENAESFTCASQAGRGLCPEPGCGFALGAVFPRTA